MAISTGKQKARTMESASTLKLWLRFSGFAVATAANTDPHALAVDTAIARRMRCGHCKKRGLRFTGFRHGQQYKGIAECDRCGSGEEV